MDGTSWEPSLGDDYARLDAIARELIGIRDRLDGVGRWPVADFLDEAVEGIWDAMDGLAEAME